MNHTYSSEYCEPCDDSYRSYGCVANNNAGPTPDKEEREALTEEVAYTIGYSLDEEAHGTLQTTNITRNDVDGLVDLILAQRREAAEAAIFNIMSPKTEGLFDDGELFIKRKPIEQAIINMIGYEKYKAMQEAVDAQLALPNQENKKEEV